MYPAPIAAAHPDRLAYVMAGSGARLTYAVLEARSNAVAHLLRERGVRPGDGLVLVLPNSLTWPVVVAAGMRTGLQVTPLNWHVGAAELAPMLEDADAGAVVTDAGLAPSVLAALAELEAAGRLPRRPVVLVADGGPVPAGAEALEEAAARWPTTPVEGELLGARTLFSGGTTGRPKAYRQPLPGVHPAQAPPRHAGLGAVLGLTGGNDAAPVRFLSPAPSYHAAPFTFQLMVLAAGGTVVCLERFDAEAAWAAVREHEVTHSQWVPTMLSRLVALPAEVRALPAPSHRVAVTSGAPCAPDLKDAVQDWWGGILHEYYGASEGYGHTHIGPADARVRRGSVGRPLDPEVTVRIVDDAGVPLPAGEVGAVVFVRPDPAVPDAELARGMGDRGRVDEDGFLYLAGRASFMVISGGVNIYPEEIEAVLSSHPDVVDVAVVGVPHADLGEQVLAVVQPRPDLAVPDLDGLPDRLLAHCEGRLARFKHPRRFAVVESLPRLPTGKLNKADLQRQHAAAVAATPDQTIR